MSTATPEPAAEAPARSTRVSSRVRTKSARALANEHTENLLAAAREVRHEKEKEREQRQRGASELSRTVDGEEGDSKEAEAAEKDEEEAAGGDVPDNGKKPRRQAAPKKPRKSKYCVCKEARQGPMIECGECGDWFHFECISLKEDEAERIHKYVCASCTERTGEKTTYVYDIKGFPSPTPEADAPDAPIPGRTAPKRATKGKGKKAEPEPEPKPEPEKEETEPEKEPAAEPAAEASTSDAQPATETKDTEEPAVGEKRKAEDEGAESKPSPKPTPTDGAVSDAESAVSATSAQRKRLRREKPKPAPIHVPSPPAKSPSASTKRASIAERGRSTSASIPPTPKTPVPKTPKTPASGGSAPLPPARKYVMDKLASAIRGIFGEAAMTPEAAQEYGQEVEASLYAHFKEMVKGKEAAGGRYKAQFNLLYSSLSKVSEVRDDLRAAIVDGTIPPAKVATLTGVELASAAQLAVIEAANKEALRQTVMIKEREVRIVAGRDGLEDLDDRNETVSEMQRQEERDRRRENGLGSDDDMDMDLLPPLPRRESVNTNPERRESVSSGPGGSPTATQRPTPVKRGSSTISATPTAQSPLRPTINLSSAWGGRQASPEPVAEEEMDLDGEEDIDLSHIVSEDVDYSTLDDKPEEPKPAPPENTAMNAFLARPVEWSGALTNPAADSRVAPPVQLRLGAGRTHFSIPRLLPSPTVTIAGRVPTATSLKYLTDRLMDRSSELLPTIFTLAPSATPDEEKAWAAIVDFHVQRGRHGVFHPYDNRPALGTARELYLVPLQPGDAWPDLFSLISGFALPREIDRPVMVGVFVASRERGEPDRDPKNGVRPEHRSPMEPPPAPAPAPAPPPAAAAAAPPNLQLQALMASLNPAAIAGVMARPAPPPPQPQHQYEGYEREPYAEQYNPVAGPGYSPPPQNAYAPDHQSYYPPPPPGYGAGPAPSGPRFGGYSPTAGAPVPGPVHGPGAGGPGGHGPGGPVRGRPPFDPRPGFRGGFGGGRGRRGRGRGRW